MSIQRFSIRYPVSIIMLFAGIILLGVISLDRLSIDLFPDISTPKIKIELLTTDKSPEEVEKKFTELIEKEVSTINNLKRVSSISTIGKVIVELEFYWDTDMDFTLLDVQKKVGRIANENDVRNLTVSKDDFQSLPIMTLAYYSENIEDIDRLRKEAEEAIVKRLVTLEGVAKGEIFGGHTKEVYIELDRYKLQAYDISDSEIISKILNTNVDASGGRIEDNETVYLVKGIGKFKNPAEINELIVGMKTKIIDQETQSAEKIPIYLKDVAKVYYQKAPIRNYTRYNRENCIGLNIYKEAGANTVKVSAEIKKELDNIKQDLPESKIEIVNEQSEFINLSIRNLRDSLFIGILLAVLIIYIFLRNFYSTIIISLAIPVSIIATFNLMYYFDLSINLMTLGGLALGAGMLVDNAIIVIENIFRHREKGTALIEAVDKGTSEVGAAISSSTLTTIIVFFPIVYVKGIGAEFFKDQGITVVFALLSSLLVAFTLIPMMSSRFLKQVKTKTESSRWKEKYAVFLRDILKKRKIVLLLTLVLVVVCIFILPKLETKLIPESNIYEFDINVKLPQGQKIEYTESVVERVEEIVYSVYPDGIEKIFSTVGETPEKIILEGDANTGSVYIRMRKNDDFLTPHQFFNRLKAALEFIEGANIEINYHMTSLEKAFGQKKRGVAVQISGTDLESLNDISQQLMIDLSQVEGLYNIDSDLKLDREEVIIELDRTISSSFGLDVSDVAGQIRKYIEGENTGEMFYDGDDRIIRISYPDVYLNEIENFNLKTGIGNYIKLKNIGDISLKKSPVYIYRTGQKKSVTVFADINRDFNYNLILNEVKNRINQKVLPKNYNIQLAGEEEERQESFRSLRFALILAVILVYMVMAALFESLILPFTIMFTLPLAGIGTVLVFFLFGEPISLMAIIGIIMLAGIAVNDSIVLVDCINRYQKSGLELKSAIVDAGRDRLRPIIITTLTTVLALFPLIIGIGEGSELRRPLALAVISGLISSTFLTLVVIPIIYFYFMRFVEYFRK